MAAATCLWASYNVIQIPNLCKLHLGKYCYFIQKVLLSACHIPGTVLASRNPEGANQKKPALVELPTPQRKAGQVTQSVYS